MLAHSSTRLAAPCYWSPAESPGRELVPEGGLEGVDPKMHDFKGHADHLLRYWGGDKCVEYLSHSHRTIFSAPVDGDYL